MYNKNRQGNNVIHQPHKIPVCIATNSLDNGERQNPGKPECRMQHEIFSIDMYLPCFQYRVLIRDLP